jgi:hypothetical protein
MSLRVAQPTLRHRYGQMVTVPRSMQRFEGLIGQIGSRPATTRRSLGR